MRAIIVGLFALHMSATAATVPENEVVATLSVEGEYPKALNELIEKIGSKLGGKLAEYTHSTPPAQPADRYIRSSAQSEDFNSNAHKPSSVATSR